jgi:protein-L-isoaspartate(D-aspartate) O-methyltransferase
MRKILAFLGLLFGAQGLAADEAFAPAQEQMLRDIRATMRQVGDHDLHISDEVLAAVGRVKRHEFVPPDLRDEAYENRPLPIGGGQTISQPYIVALMSQLLGVGAGSKVLEVGTGSGYQAAVLAELGAEVYSIEIVRDLGERAALLLKRLGYASIQTRIGDGYAGWPEAAPFDGIIVTAAPDHVPAPLVAQLKTGARMVIPVGTDDQKLTVITKNADGSFRQEEVLTVGFVPLTGTR